MPEETLDYVEDQDVEDDADNNADEEDDNDDNDEEMNDDDDTLATSQEKKDGDEDRPGERETNMEWDGKKKEEQIPFNFEEEMEVICKHLESTHRHQIEELLHTD